MAYATVQTVTLILVGGKKNKNIKIKLTEFSQSIQSTSPMELKLILLNNLLAFLKYSTAFESASCLVFSKGLSSSYCKPVAMPRKTHSLTAYQSCWQLV